MVWTAFICLLPGLWGQSRNELEDRRKELIREINQTTQKLEQTQQSRAALLDSYFTLQTQINKRQELISTLREEIVYTDASIERTNEVLLALQDDFQRLKTEYAGMLRSAYRHKQTRSYLLFLFSADSFNDAFRRWQYLRQYDRYRSRQADLIRETQTAMTERTAEMEKRRAEKKNLLASSEQQQHLLAQEMDQKNKLLNNLKADEKKLVADLKDQQTRHEQLNNAIESVIREEMARKRRDARNPEALVAARNPEERPALSSDFRGNRGRLPWPVNSGVITRFFGPQPHPTLKQIMIPNNGIDIETMPSAEVYAVFDGTVVGTRSIPGHQNMVILQHGEYYTVYVNLEEVFVERGDTVKGQQIIGRIGSDRTELHFEVWREKQRLDPATWVGNP